MTMYWSFKLDNFQNFTLNYLLISLMRCIGGKIIWSLLIIENRQNSSMKLN